MNQASEMSERALEKELSELVADAAATPQTLRAKYDELATKVKIKRVGASLLRAAIKSNRPEMVQAVLDIGTERPVSSTDMCVAFMAEVSDAVLDVLDAVFKHTKIRTLMDGLVECTHWTNKSLLHFRHAFERYGKGPTVGCWKMVNVHKGEWYAVWHAELYGKVSPVTLRDFEIQQIVCTLRNGGAWKERLRDLESKGFVITLDALKRVRCRLRALQDFQEFVTHRLRKAGGIQASIAKKAQLQLRAK